MKGTWDQTTVTWNTAPQITEVGYGVTPVHFGYQQEGTFSLDIRSYVANTLTASQHVLNLALVGKNDTTETRKFERSVFELKLEEPLHIGREVQRDLPIGNARLEVTYR